MRDRARRARAPAVALIAAVLIVGGCASKTGDKPRGGGGSRISPSGPRAAA